MSHDDGVVRAPDTRDLEAELEAANHELEAAKAELAELQQSYQRLAADLDNQRRRAREQVERATGRERGELLREVLAIVDDLERAVKASLESSDEDLRAGLEAVVRETHRMLERRGVKRMDSIGKSFDPERHEAVGLAEGGEGMIHAEVKPGYLLNGDVLRPAEVLVGKSEGR